MRANNILLIMADQLRADALGCYGNPICKTPHIDHLASKGTLFTNCMVTQPTCTPSRASILTGCFPSALRSRMVGCVTPDDARFLPRLLGTAGYRTAAIGKMHLAPQHQEPKLIEASKRADGSFDYYGFQEVDLVNGHGMRCFGAGYTEWLCERVSDPEGQVAASQWVIPGLNNATGSLKTQRWGLPPEVHSGEYITERATHWLQQSATDQNHKSFFLQVSFPDPHQPFTVPEPYASMYRPSDMPVPLAAVSAECGATALQLATYHGAYSSFVPGSVGDHLIGTPPDNYSRYELEDWQASMAIYYGMVSLLDAQVGRLMQTLHDTGLEQNTLVVFVADHGDYMGDHGFSGKGFHYQSVIRTPLIVCGPSIRAGVQANGMASTVDLASTILDWTNIDAPTGMQGVSMHDVLVNATDTLRTAALTENDDDFVPMKARTLTTLDWKLTWYCGATYGELYDRRQDPNELQNLWDDPAVREVKSKLLQRLLEEVVCALDVVNGRIQAPRPPIAKWLPT